MADEITSVQIGDVVVGWVEYDPESDQWQAKLRGESAARKFHFHNLAVKWVLQQHNERDVRPN